MSRAAIDSELLRGRLEHTLRFDMHHDGSLYLNALACCYMAAPDDAEPVLCRELHLQAESENVSADDVLTALCLAVPE
jgi:hypothetical protein